uniref:Uncharacterized protein n=1 Tax=Sphaerodactylus townsendi TaxID=933632 RepID=A0ACB8EP33_9SAUR
MEQKGTEPSSLPAESPCPKNENPACGDEELDEETLNFIAALDVALGPLLPEVTKLQAHQDPPAHLMVDMKARLTEQGVSVSDARKKLLQYNLYLKKKLAKIAQEKKTLKEPLKEDVGVQPQSAEMELGREGGSTLFPGDEEKGGRRKGGPSDCRWLQRPTSKFVHEFSNPCTYFRIPLQVSVNESQVETSHEARGAKKYNRL